MVDYCSFNLYFIKFRYIDPYNDSVKLPYTTLVFDPELDWICKEWQQSMALGRRKLQEKKLLRFGF